MNLLANFTHKREMRESKDEILVGEVIRAMSRLGIPAIGFQADTGFQSIRFKPVNDPLLYSIVVIVDRKTGGSAIGEALLGSKAFIKVQAEVKNYLADPDDLLNMYSTDFKNIFKITMLGDVKLDHQLNSVFATKQATIDIDKFILKGEDGVNNLTQVLTKLIDELRGKLAPYKKG